MLGVSLSNSIKSPRNIINLGTLEEESWVLIQLASSVANVVLLFLLSSYMLSWWLVLLLFSMALFCLPGFASTSGTHWPRETSRIYLHKSNIDPTATCH
jgi:hypothetical protein